MPVRIQNESTTPEQKDDMKKVISEIRTTNHLLQQIYSLPIEIKQLPFKLEKEKVDTEESVEDPNTETE